MISFELPTTQRLAEALRGRIEHFLHWGTIWVYGRNTAVPATEDDPLDTFGEYGTQKAAIETWLLHEFASDRLSGHNLPAWPHRRTRVGTDQPCWERQAGGVLPHRPRRGTRAAQLRARNPPSRPCRRRGATDHARHTPPICGSRARHSTPFQPRRSICEAIAKRCSAGSDTNQNSVSSRSRKWKADQSPEDADISWEHIVRSSCHSIAKARRRLGYEPRYSSLAAVQESVAALITAGRVDAPSLPENPEEAISTKATKVTTPIGR